MEPKYIHKLNDIVYEALFGKDTTHLLIFFGLSPLNLRDTDDNNLRDQMGELALEALGAIESRCADEMEQMREVEWATIEDIVTFAANEIGVEYKAAAAGSGVDLLTGKSLVATQTE